MPGGSWSMLGPVWLGRTRRAVHKQWNMWLS